jgi:N-acetyl-anhydromuramyl-L-alanine amidase AmpD
MALIRVWKPSPHHSARSGSCRLVVFHTTEGAQDIYSLANWFANPGAKVSSHVGVDNHRQGTIAEYVKRDRAAWAQGNYNSAAISVEMCTPAGAANGWSRDYWLSKQGWLLDNAAAWLAEEARAFGIPLVRLTPSQATGGSKGICGHGDIQPADRTDPGKGFPYDYVIAKAQGQKPPAAGSGGGGRPQMSVDYFGKNHNSRVPDVRTWQAKMRDWGWFNPGDVDGIFGSQSESVAKRFQTQKGLTSDGLVGPATWNATFV